MRYIKRVKNYLLLLIFIPATYFKLFTTRIIFTEDPTVQIIKTHKINWLYNNYLIDFSNINLDWYKNNDFIIIHADEMGNNYDTLYSLSVVIWWFLFFYFLIIIFKFLFNKFRNKRLYNANKA